MICNVVIIIHIFFMERPRIRERNKLLDIAPVIIPLAPLVAAVRT